MRLPILVLMACCIGFVLVGGCTTPSAPPAATPAMEQPATPTVLQTTLPVSDTETLCGELVYCGYAPAGTQPVKSLRCDELYTLRMQNDQKVLQCLKTPTETQGTIPGEALPCKPGTGTVTCTVSGMSPDRDTGLGGSGNDVSGWDRSIRHTDDGGYIVSGSITTNVSPGHGAEDMWMVKLNPAGIIQWQKVLGGRDRDESFSIQQTTDDGYILIGSTDSDNTGDVGSNHGGSDIWVVKLNPAGGIQWQKVLGGSGFESGRSIEQTTDGGYILTGVTDSDNTGNVGPNHGGSDIWVVQLNTVGDIQWQKVLGGSGRDESYSIRQMNGGSILTGSTDSDNSGDVGSNHGGSDVWVVQLNPAGGIQWQKLLGGTGFESGRSIEQTTDDGYILTGSTDSDNTGDVGTNPGGSAIWVVKLNPAGDFQWQKVLGGNGFESGRSIEQTTIGGFILAGNTDSDNTGDVGPNHGGSALWVVNLNPAGDIQWQLLPKEAV